MLIYNANRWPELESSHSCTELEPPQPQAETEINILAGNNLTKLQTEASSKYIPSVLHKLAIPITL